MKKDEIEVLSKEKMKLLTKVNTLLEEMLDEKDENIRVATSELIKQLKSNISEIEQRISFLEQAGDEEEDEQGEEDSKEEQDIEDVEDEEEEEYMDEPNISIGRSDDGTLLAVYDKRRKKQK